METTFAEFRRGFAARLKTARGELTQAQVAGLSRFTQQMISRYESGRVPRALWFLANLSRAGLDVDWLLTGRRRSRSGARRLPPPDRG